jgi:hypothetical protein
MKKLILGIVGIVVLDLAFILALIDVDDPTELAAVEPSRPISRQTQLRHFPRMPVVDAAPIEDADVAAPAKPVLSPTQSRDYSTKTPVRTKAAFDSPTSEISTPNFKDTIIWYQGPNREIGRQDSLTAVVPAKAQPDEPVRKKRNVLSRAFLITKKPYDWVKSLASKF